MAYFRFTCLESSITAHVSSRGMATCCSKRDYRRPIIKYLTDQTVAQELFYIRLTPTEGGRGGGGGGNASLPFLVESFVQTVLAVQRLAAFSASEQAIVELGPRPGRRA